MAAIRQFDPTALPPQLTVKSRFREYTVDFIHDSRPAIRTQVERGAVFVVDRGALHWARDLIALIPQSQQIALEATEETKTLEATRVLIDRLVACDFKVNRPLVALGGGVIQDLTAFTASILFRGVEWVFFPTTLLAQADSCVGSKTSINVGQRKNLAGNFYPPTQIYIDPLFLESLPEDEVRSGIGEIMHFLVYADSAMLEPISRNHAQLLVHREDLLPFISESLRIKKSVAELDELDRGERNKFNYGHTFGHALESLTNYHVKHGIAVTVGMDLANFISVHLGLLSYTDYEAMRNLFTFNFPRLKWSELDLNRYFELLSHDKKNVGDQLTCILCAGKGKLLKQQIPLNDELKAVVREHFCTLPTA